MTENVYKAPLREMPLGELVWVRSARRPERVAEFPFKGSAPYIDIKALETASPSRYAEGAGLIISERDLVMVKDGHRSGKVFRAMEGIAASTLVVLSPDSNEVLLDYIYCYLTYCYEDLQRKKKGAFINHLDIQYLKHLMIPVLSFSKQRVIAEKYQRIESLTCETKEKTLRLKELSNVLGSKDLKIESENLNLQVEMIQKAWLHQIFNKPL